MVRFFFVWRVHRQLIGYGMCFVSYSTWDGRTLLLKDLFVRPNYRRHGVGRQLYTEIVRFAYSTNSGRIDLHLPNCYEATAFFKRMGADNLTEEKDFLFYRLSL